MLSVQSVQPAPAATKYVFDFAEGGRELADLLGGKGAGLAEMSRLGLPVPPGFTITTEACRHYLRSGAEPAELAGEIDEHLSALEELVGRRLGQDDDPLLVSVRSGAKFSMPGMMETVLDIGLTDRSVLGLAGQLHDDHFALDSYRRLIQMFGRTVLGIDDHRFADVLAAARASAGEDDAHLSVAALRTVVAAFKQIVLEQTGREFPQDPREQLALAVRAVFGSWHTERAALYRRREGIADDLGTAVNVMAMVFGNKGTNSGTGVAFTRDPASGQRGLYGDYLADAQGEDVVSGVRNALPVAELERLDPHSYGQLLHNADVLERHYRDLCDIEFTVECGKLWMLQTRVGKRTPAAAFRIACQLVDEGVIDLDEALRRVTGRDLAQLMFPQFKPGPDAVRLTTGVNASPGAAVGTAVFDSATAVRRAEAGEQVILVRRETTPDDLAGIVAAAGVLTTHGGKTAHAAVVARGMGKPCVCGAEGLTIDSEHRLLAAGNRDRRRATRSRSTAPRERCTSAGSRYSRRRSSTTSTAASTLTRPMPTTWSAPSTGCSSTPTPNAASVSGRTLTRPKTPPAPADSAPPESACAALSTCSSETGASTSSAWCSPTARPSGTRHSPRCSRYSVPTSSAFSRRCPACR